MKIYAGIGSRKAPPEILAKAERIAIYFARRNWKVRSGGANGMDTYFALGAKAINEKLLEEHLPYKGFNGSNSTFFTEPSQEAFKIAQHIHPVWNALSQGDKTKMARNILQILGQELDSPVKFVICWTPDGCESFHTRSRDTGGTGQAIALASMLGIPVFNLKNKDWRDRLIAFVDSLERPIIEQPTQVVHCRDDNNVYIGRKIADFGDSIFRNIFKIDENATRDEQLKKYLEYLKQNPEILKLAKFLKGKRLGCWCRHENEQKPDCHGDILVAAAEGRDIDSAYVPAQKTLF